MYYVMSDIYGEYDKYLEMIEKINLTDDDTLYILGNVVDKGDEPIEILTDMAERPNVYPIFGDHDRIAVDVLTKLMKDIEQGKLDKLSADTMQAVVKWQKNGGQKTLEGFIRLTTDEKQDILDYLCDFSLFEVVDIDDKSYILVHQGLGNFEEHGKKLRNYTAKDLTDTEVDYDKQYFDDDSVFIVTGHVPTADLCGEDKIYKSHNNICINCGVSDDGRLACLCLDTMEEFYID